KMRMPEKASDPAALPLIGSSRLIDQGPAESNAAYAKRLTKFIEQWRRAGQPLGMLLALYYAGFGAVIVQQNGLAYSLSLPLNDDDPTQSLTITSALGLSVALTSQVNPPTVVSSGRSVPAGTPFFTVKDDDTDFCSRFAVLFPGAASLPTSNDVARLSRVINK